MKKDDLPYMPFYVGDWLKAPDIQCLPYDLKGLWFEMLCYMWESKERGVLLYTMEELSRLLRLPEVLLEQKLKQLLDFAICSAREHDGAIYCRRMVRDQKIREIRKKAGYLGGKASFASRFGQPKKQANVDIDIDNENEDGKEDRGVGKETNINRQHPYFKDPEFTRLWNNFKDMRKKLRKPVTEHAITLLLKKLNKWPIEIAKKSLENSIERSWTSVFEPKEDFKSQERPLDQIMREQHPEHFDK